MSTLLIGLLGLLAATNPPATFSNLVKQTNGVAVKAPDPDDPVHRELKQLMAQDDAAQAEVDDWIVENQKFAQQGGGVPRAELNQRIVKRFEPIRKGYEDLLKRHPEHVAARVAFASFLNDLGELDEAVVQLEKARDLNPNDAAIWNNLGVYYSDGHHGPPIKAFPSFEKAVELNPKESLYYHNFAVTVYMYRTDAKEYYHINEAQVFDKALGLYAQAFRLDPTNFPLATDFAESYYTIRPLRTDEALVAWTNALNIAHDDLEREGVYIHLARIKMLAGRYAEARAQLTAVTNESYTELKTRLTKSITARESGLLSSNAPPSKAP
jgi:tetratricopeptide (TPR) repeat protein